MSSEGEAPLHKVTPWLAVSFILDFWVVRRGVDEGGDCFHRSHRKTVRKYYTRPQTGWWGAA